MRGQRQDAAVPEQAAPRVVRIRHLAERRTTDAADAVVAGQALVDERVVGGQQLQRRPVCREPGARTAARSRAPSHRPATRRSTGTTARRARPGPDPAAGATAPRTACSGPRPASASIRRTCRSSMSVRASPPSRATASSSASGIVPQRKNDSRDARSTLLIRYGCRASPRPAFLRRGRGSGRSTASPAARCGRRPRSRRPARRARRRASARSRRRPSPAGDRPGRRADRGCAARRAPLRWARPAGR